MPKYQAYKSEITGKYYVKYPNSEEKEISKIEYEFLINEKNRILNNITKK